MVSLILNNGGNNMSDLSFFFSENAIKEENGK